VPALPPVPNVIKARLFWTVEGDPMAVTILYFHYAGGAPDEGDLGSFLNAMDNAAQADLPGMFQSGVTYESSDVRDLSSITGSYVAVSNPTPGTRSGGKLSPGTAAVVNYAIKQSYRGGKPRSYMPFGTSTDVATTGLWADAFVTAYEGAVQSFISDSLGTYGGIDVDKQCVVSYYGPPNKVITNPTTGRARTVSTRRDAPGGTGAPIRYDITGQRGSKVIGSQRRRNRNA
jgi:hypothetical protein